MNTIDPDSDEARLARHRKACSMWPGGRPETHAERQLREALDIMDAVLNSRSFDEAQRANERGRQFLEGCGR